MTKTVTIQTNQIFDFTSDDSVRQQLANYIAGVTSYDVGITIISVTRPLFSGRYLITVDSTYDDDTYVGNTILSAMEAIGFTNSTLTAVDDSGTSSQPGGLTQVASDVETGVTSAAGTVTSIVKPAVIIIAIGAAVALMIYSDKR